MLTVDEYFEKFKVNSTYTESFRKQVEQHVEDLSGKEFLLLPYFSGYSSYLNEGNRIELENIYFQRRRDAVALALFLQWNPNSDKIKLFEEMLFSICQEYSWALPAHIQIDHKQKSYLNANETVDLFASETAHFLAECTVLFRKIINPTLLEIIKTEIEKRVLNPFIQKDWGFEKLRNNWSAVCTGAIGITAMILIKDEEVKKKVLTRVENALSCFLEGYGEDGACVEGMGYWVYGIGYYTYFADMYEKVAGIDLFKNLKWKNIILFPLIARMPSGNFLPFSDSPETVIVPSGLNSYFFNKFNIVPAYEESITDFHFDHCYRWGHLSRTLWWSTEKVRNAYQNLYGEFVFNDANWVILKRKKLYFAAKGGNNDESHNHNDLGHFILGDHNGLIFDDLGAPVYTADYFGAKRYEYVHPRSYWHSVPYIDKQEQLPGSNYFAFISNVYNDDHEFSVTIDLQHAYPNLKDNPLKRSYMINDLERRLLIKDTVGKPVHYETHFISRIKPNLLEDKVIWKEGEWTLQFNKNLLHAHVECIEIKNHFNQSEMVYNIIFTTKKEENKVYTFLVNWAGGEFDE